MMPNKLANNNAIQLLNNGACAGSSGNEGCPKTSAAPKKIAISNKNVKTKYFMTYLYD